MTNKSENQVYRILILLLSFLWGVVVGMAVAVAIGVVR